MKLHELKQKRNTIATDMRALHDKIGDNTWTDEQRTQWNAAKSELDSLMSGLPVKTNFAARTKLTSTTMVMNSDRIYKTI